MGERHWSDSEEGNTIEKQNKKNKKQEKHKNTKNIKNRNIKITKKHCQNINRNKKM